MSVHHVEVVVVLLLHYGELYELGTVVVGGGAGGVGCSRGFEIVIAAGRVDVWSSLRSRRDSRAANSQDVDRMVVGSRLGF